MRNGFNNVSWRGLGALLFLGDMVLCPLSYIAVIFVRYGGQPPLAGWNALWRVSPAMVVATLLILQAADAYDLSHRSLTESVTGIATASVVSALVGSALAHMLGAYALPRGVIALGLVCQTVLLTAWRLPFLLEARARLRSRMMVLVSHQPSTARRWISMKSFLDVGQVISLTPAQLMGTMEHETLNGAAIIILEDVSTEEKSAVVTWAAMRHLEVLVYPGYYDLALSMSQPTQLGDTPLLRLQKIDILKEYQGIKRLGDMVVAITGLLILLPVIFLIGFLVWATSGLPVLYSQERVGRHGKVFLLYKFRTMINNAEAETGPVWCNAQDNRVTPIGRFLRSFRLDEIPQLWNVLKGEMSLIGPRPERPFFVSQFAREEPLFRLREVVRPGITGLAQVIGSYDTDPRDKLVYDLMYIARCSPLLDLRTMARTVQTVLVPSKGVASRRPKGSTLKLSVSREQVGAAYDGGQETRSGE